MIKALHLAQTFKITVGSLMTFEGEGPDWQHLADEICDGTSILPGQMALVGECESSH